MRRRRRTAETREAFEPRQRGDRRAAIEAHAVGQRPHDGLVAARREIAQSQCKVVERREAGLDPVPYERVRDFAHESGEIGRLREVDSYFCGDVRCVAEAFEPAPRGLLALEHDNGR
jgi:hypothetical protein